MIWFLLDRMKNIEKEHNVFWLWLKAILVFLPFMIAIGFSIYINSVLLAYITNLVLLAFLYFYFKKVDKKRTKGINTYYNSYLKRLNEFRNVLKEYKLYSGNKVKKLIELCNEQKIKGKVSNELSKPFNFLFASIIIPTLILIIKWLFDNTSLADEVIQIVILIILIIFMLMGIGFMLKPMVLYNAPIG